MEQKYVKDEDVNKNLERITKQLDMMLVILLAESGLNKEEVAKILGVSGRTIQNLLPFGKLKKGIGSKSGKTRIKSEDS